MRNFLTYAAGLALAAGLSFAVASQASANVFPDTGSNVQGDNATASANTNGHGQAESHSNGKGNNTSHGGNGMGGGIR